MKRKVVSKSTEEFKGNSKKYSINTKEGRK